MLTFLAIGFVVLLIGSILYGFGIVMRRPPFQDELETEICMICRKRLRKKDLVEREVGDYKLMYFCGECIENLHADAMRRNGSAGSRVLKD